MAYNRNIITSEIYYDRGNNYEFVKLDRDLARPGDLSQSCSFPFEFLKVVKQYESYTGRNVRLRYSHLYQNLKVVF